MNDKYTFSCLIDKCSELPLLPMILTVDNPRKSVRIFGALIYIIWFFPALFLWACIVGILSIPAIMQDAWRGEI